MGFPNDEQNELFFFVEKKFSFGSPVIQVTMEVQEGRVQKRPLTKLKVGRLDLHNIGRIIMNSHLSLSPSTK